jgi:prepilin-type N-terminal cleavage/methylation domain-containing protein
MNRFMRKHSLRLYLSQRKRGQGFTLVELLVGMSITAIVAGLAMQALFQVQNSFTKDQKKVESGQKMSSVLEIIGREIRQAGELIVEPSFPTIKVRPLNGGGVSVIVYRAIVEPISICQDIAPSSSITALPFAINTNVVSSCKVDASSITGTNKFPLKEKTNWIDNRGTGTLLGMLYRGANRKTQPFIYNSEVSTSGASSMNLSIGTVGFVIPIVASDLAATPPIIGDDGKVSIGDTAYLVVKKEYFVCKTFSATTPRVELTTELKVRTNSLVESSPSSDPNDLSNAACDAPIAATDPTATLDTVATNIDRLDITMTTRAVATAAAPDPSPDPSPSLNASFPTVATSAIPAREWQNIQGVKIVIKAKDPLANGVNGRNNSVLSDSDRAKIEASFTAEGSFYPRNALSSK